MGDGGVACAPSQLIMDKFTVCGNGTSTKQQLNPSSNSSVKVASSKVKPKMKVKKVKGSKKLTAAVPAADSDKKNDEVSVNVNDDDSKDEVEEGELGTLPIENGEFVPPERSARRYEIRSEIEKGEFVPGRWRRNAGELDRHSKDELEKGEFVPERWYRNDTGHNKADQYSYSKNSRRHDPPKDKGWKGDREWASPSAKERGWKFDRDNEWNQPAGKEKGWKAEYDWSPPKEKGWKCERTPPPPPPSGKHTTDKEFRKSGSSSQQFRKFASRYEAERTPKNSYKGAGEEGFPKTDISNGQNHARDHSFSNRLKRHGNDSDSSERKYHVDYDEYASSKNRKLSDDGSRFSSDHYSGRTYKKASSSSSRNIPPERYSSRYSDSSRSLNDRRISSPHQSPNERSRNYDRAHSPARRDKSPNDRNHQQDRSMSPYDRSRRYDNRYRSPSHAPRSPRDSGRNRDDRDRSPSIERSPQDRGRYSGQRQTYRKGGVGEKRSNLHKDQEGRYGTKGLAGRDSKSLAKESDDREKLDNGNCSNEKAASSLRHGEELHNSPSGNVEPSMENGVTEEPASMEEDMDICDTPPHVPVVIDAFSGKWYYLDQFGEERGPTKLCDLRTLVDEGHLTSDHFIKHFDGDRWVTVENAVSPLMPANFPSVVPESVTQLVCPPEAPGNLLEDNGKGTPSSLADEELLAPTPTLVMSNTHNKLVAPETGEDLRIDERVGAFLKGITFIPGKELEIIAEVLKMTIELGDWESWGRFEGYFRNQLQIVEHCDDKVAEYSSGVSEYENKDHAESLSSEKDSELCCSDTGGWFSGQWALKGGDWKINDESTIDNPWRRKLVLNDGYPLCQMPKSGCEDPRWQRKDELYYPSLSRRLDLPSWAFTLVDELNDPSSRSSQSKSVLARGVKGTMLPVIRINACVVTDHGSFISEPRGKAKGKERYSGKSSRPYSTTGDTKRSSEDSHSKSSRELDSHDSWKKAASFTIPKDRLCRVDELQLHLGDWYYLDGAGHERGPSSFAELQGMADQGVIQKHSSIFRKRDKLWVPLNLPPELSGITEHENSVTSSTSHSETKRVLSDQIDSGGFHDLHPQFIGYTQGKLHELVMKSYKSREFAAAINEVLDPWINARQPRKEMEKYTYDHFRSSKRARTDGTEEEYGIEEDESTLQKDDCSFDDLCSDINLNKGIELVPEVESGSWDLLNGHVLARIFYFLRADLKSLIYAASTCKYWRSTVKFYKNISRQVDFSSTAPNGSDTVILNIMNDYNREKITSIILRGCTGISSGLLEELLPSLPCLSSVDIRGCAQLEDLVGKFPRINWIRNFPPQYKMRSLNHLTDKGPSTSNQMEYSSGLKEYLENSAKRDSANQLFRRSLYKRSKLFDARKSSSISSRDAQLRRLAMKKYGNGYKRMEEFIASSLRNIMKNNTFEFFEAKVADIEERMKNGYYASCGLNTVKEDIKRMCNETKTRGDARDLEHITKLFNKLAKNLEKSSKLAYGKDEMMKSWKDFIPPGFLSAPSKYKKNLTKLSKKKQSYRSNGSSSANGYADSGDYASDRETRRRQSKVNKKSFDSGSDTSDDFDKSSPGSETDRESTASETESDVELQSATATRESRRETNFTPDYGFDSWADDREWGARMTKASLVPPVTRKYEVIDHYVIVADEEEVKRKMQVSLPEDYDEKFTSQRNGTEESDMEIPEVKDYKPRKSLGEEVIEQEVYGIDPYTHNLLLDSMPDESDWSLVDKHLFIEDVLLRSLNKQVRNFTGSGNTPMVYPLKPVFEELVESARENYDKRTMRLCQFIIKAIDSRPEDKYVAYRKGLGVLCNKQGGFSEDDFVVEFLGEVYPTWKWYEKQDGIRALQKNKDEPAPEFYNIYLERPKGDADGYDLVVVDAMHKANYASRICHSCKPNCEAKVTAVDGQYQIGIYSVRPIAYGEEITFDYNSVTESKEEYEASVCLCGNQVCRGSYLNLTGEGAYQKVLKQHHGLLDRHRMLLEACELNSVSEEDYIDLGKAGLGSCLLGGLPDWLIAYSARLVRFINFERTELPNEIFRHNVEEKKKYLAEIQLDVEKSDAEIQAEGVYNQRLQNLALTIDKVRYVMRCVFGDPKSAPPPLERLSPEAAVSFLWKGEGSFVDELIRCVGPHMDDVMLRDLKAKIHAHDPSASDDVEMGLKKSLLWLRDEVRNLPCTYKVRHDAAADLIHIHAYTKSFIRMREYTRVTSPPVYITPLDLGPKYADKLGPGVHEYCKTYGETYCLGQLMFWYNQSAEPDAILEKASRGCLSLPDVGSFYAKVQQPSRQRVYGRRTVKFMLSRMEKQPQRPWPKDQIWSFKSSLRVVGSPMLDAVLHDSSVDKDMVHWLKHRHSVYQATWDK